MIDGSPLKRRLKKFHDSMTTGVASSTSSAFVKDLPSAKADTGKGGTLAMVAFAHGFRHWIRVPRRQAEARLYPALLPIAISVPLSHDPQVAQGFQACSIIQTKP